jgi:hypothetical protein
MPRRRRVKAETTLVQHRTPDLAALLVKAKTCELAPLRRFLINAPSRLQQQH